MVSELLDLVEIGKIGEAGLGDSQVDSCNTRVEPTGSSVCGEEAGIFRVAELGVAFARVDTEAHRQLRDWKRDWILLQRLGLFRTPLACLVRSTFRCIAFPVFHTSQDSLVLIV